eukprot:364993-Chlamydomonas_euryale.AAC.5
MPIAEAAAPSGRATRARRLVPRATPLTAAAAGAEAAAGAQATATLAAAQPRCSPTRASARKRPLRPQ